MFRHGNNASLRDARFRTDFFMLFQRLSQSRYFFSGLSLLRTRLEQKVSVPQTS